MSSVVAKLVARRETLERWIRESLSHVISVVEAKKTLVIRSRDIERYLGVRDRIAKSHLGLVLGLLSEIGLAERLSNRKPRLYALTPRSEWRAFIETCKHDRFRCIVREDSCQLVGTCPYWRLINYIGVGDLNLTYRYKQLRDIPVNYLSEEQFNYVVKSLLYVAMGYYEKRSRRKSRRESRGSS
jgi:hypothetical protein